MASYTKTLNLIAKDFFETTINTETTVIKNNYFGDFYWGKDEIPLWKTIKKITVNIYCKRVPSTKAQIRFYNVVEEEVYLNRGWNSIELYTSHIVFPSTKPIIEVSHADPTINNDDIEIYTHASSYKPYVTITYEDTPPNRPTNLYPDNIIVNARNIIRFSWVHGSIEKVEQKGFTLQYSTNNGSTWATVTKTTSNQYYDLPANTLPLTGEILWRVKTKDQNDLESPYSEGKFNTAIVPPKAPIIKSPTTGYLDGERSIKFEWEFVQGTSEDVQNKYDLEYSLDKGLNWIKITKTSSEQYYILPENTLPSGNIYWRIKTYNQFGDASPYSEIANFYIIASPPLPQITSVSNNAKPLIKWNATEQQLFEIQILQNDKAIIDTGQIIGANTREYRVDNYLKDGNYTVKLRVMNEYNLNSPWAELNFIISTVKPLKPIVGIYSGEYSVTIKGGFEGATNLVYRENICIGEIVDGYFADYTGENNKEYEYFIRTIDENDNFNDSEIKIGKCSFRYNMLASKNSPEDFMLLKYGLNNIPRKTTRIGNIGNLVYFDGREYPRVEFTEFKELNKTLSFHLRNKEELDYLLKLIDKKEVLLYRDVEGENIEGVIFYVDFERVMFGYKIDLIITKVGDHSD